MTTIINNCLFYLTEGRVVQFTMHARTEVGYSLEYVQIYWTVTCHLSVYIKISLIL